MTVKIIKCSCLIYWYRDSIGKIFEVAKFPDGRVKIMEGSRQFSYIFEGDYIEVQE